MRRVLAGLVVTAAVLSAPSPRACAADRSGALAAFTSNDPVVVAARAMIQSGRLSGAEQLLASQPSSDPDVQHARNETAELIRRIRIDYPLDDQAMLSRVKPYVPSAVLVDLEKWAGEGTLQSRAIDGQTRYFSLEPANLLRFSDDVRSRRDREGGRSDTVATDDHPERLCEYIKQVLAAAEKSNSPEVMPVRFRIDYTIVIPPNTPGINRGSVASVWMPFPQRYNRQRDVTWIQPSQKPGEPTLASGVAPAGIDALAQVAGAPQRSQFFQKTISDPSQPTVFQTSYTFRTAAHCPKLRDELVKPLPADWGNAYLDERPPHIIFTPQVRDLVKKIVRSETNPLSNARSIYHWIGKNIQYCDEEEYSIIPSLTDHCLAKRRGDCGVQTMTFITLCRAAGIPARWQSGWEIWPGHVDLHDWAEFYVAPYGWLVADPSYIVRDATDPRVEDFYFGHTGAYRMIVNLDYGREFIPPKFSVRSEPLDFQRGEVEVDGHNLYFNLWSYEMKVQELDN